MGESMRSSNSGGERREERYDEEIGDLRVATLT